MILNKPIFVHFKFLLSAKKLHFSIGVLTVICSLFTCLNVATAQQVIRPPSKTVPATDARAEPSAPDRLVSFQPSQSFNIDTDPARPFKKRYDAPDFGRGTKWLNTAGPLRNKDLHGKFVLIDFWTYCCINCIHIMPTLQKIEEKYPNELVVIGVHSAKFETEKDDQNIIEAILRYEIRHPVINDKDHRIWDAFGVRSWPSLLILDPAGKMIWAHQGEVSYEELDESLAKFIRYYDSKGLVDRTPLHIELAEYSAEKTPLRFPGKVLADPTGNRLFISDSNHNRIVVTDLNGKLLEIIGGGDVGSSDGDYQTANFDHPQGMALSGDSLYIADTENHLIRKVDLEKRQVSTVAGTGKQARHGFPGYENLRAGDKLPLRWVGKPLETAIASPWDLLVHGDALFIAMAGPHQIWKMKIDGSEVGPYAGNGREDIVDGKLLPRQPYAEGYSSFAQPSGLTTDGTWLYVADSEGSSIRAVPFDPEEEVKTVIGTSHLPYNRLFTFGDVDGRPRTARLQHALGVAWKDGQIYTADTYNNKIKVVDSQTGDVKTLVGDGKPGNTDDVPRFDEPAGVSIANDILFVADTNNHSIRAIDLNTNKVQTLLIEGLSPPPDTKTKPQPSFENAEVIQARTANLRAIDKQIKIDLDFRLGIGWKLNPATKVRIYIDAEEDGAVIDKARLEDFYEVTPDERSVEFSLPVKADGAEEISVKVIYYYCQKGGEGLCKIGNAVWKVPLSVSKDSSEERVKLEIQVGDSKSVQSPFFPR